MSTNFETRAAIVAEARRWLGTPFHHRQRCHGRGVDCVNLLIAVYSAAGAIREFETPWYPQDWHLHRDGEMLIETLRRYARPVKLEDAGDVAVYGYGRTVSHAAIVENEDFVIHAYAPAGAVCRTERKSLESRLAAEWTARHPSKGRIASYWSLFQLTSCEISERIAA